MDLPSVADTVSCTKATPGYKDCVAPHLIPFKHYAWAHTSKATHQIFEMRKAGSQSLYHVHLPTQVNGLHIYIAPTRTIEKTGLFMEFQANILFAQITICSLGRKIEPCLRNKFSSWQENCVELLSKSWSAPTQRYKHFLVTPYSHRNNSSSDKCNDP